eukprot:scaffold1717_cov169-Amphora_coffeaeformis.AAC.12
MSTVLFYSDATKQRIQGKDRSQALTEMAHRMQTSPDKLQNVLKRNLSTLNPESEKAEYIDWLLKDPTMKEKVSLTATTATPSQAAPADQLKKTTTTSTTTEQQTFSTDVMFADRSDMHPHSKRAIAEMGLKSMTEIQAKTFEAASSGRDVLARARTGTGKTVAFLLPAIERILQSDSPYRAGQNIGIVVVSPTRELATQIANEAEKLLAFHKNMNVQVMFGGTNTQRDIQQLQRKLPAILVATPGRLLDHLQTARVGNKDFGKDIMSQTPVVVLDETDRLLDMGFRDAIVKILNYMPKGDKRQTLLFSATIPPELKIIMSQNMRKDYIEVDCINDGDAASHTNAQVQQSHVIVPFADRFVPSVVELVQHAMKQDENAKVVVFFPTARMVAFFSELFNVGLNIPVMELHSKKTQTYRNRVSDQFRKTKRGILFTSDVSARGVDYPNVSHVIQFGIPESREQYIHRLGRTGRGGTEGKGWLVLSDWESLFLNELKGLDIPVNKELHQIIESPMSTETAEMLTPVVKRIGTGDKVLTKSAQGAYQAFLGYYKGQMKRMKMRRLEDLVHAANEFSAMMGLHEPPKLSAQMVGKMGLKGVHGVNVGIDTDFGVGRHHHGSGHGGGHGGGPAKSKLRHQDGHRGHHDGRRPPKTERARKAWR